MHVTRRSTPFLALGVLCALLCTGPTFADDAAPGSGQMGMPDLRGLSENDALRAIAAAGLRAGGVERVNPEQLQRDFGRTFPAGTVVQQMPHPATPARPVWVTPGTPVRLRIVAASSLGAPMPMPMPVQPSAPTGQIPPRPPPPGGTTTYAAPLVPDLRPQVTPPLELGTGRWHARLMVPVGFWIGDDEGDPGLYAGLDVGTTFADGFGVDVFYRAAGGYFDRVLPTGVLEDGGVWHHFGVKGTYTFDIPSAPRFYGWAGVGASFYATSGYESGDEGIAGLGEVGVGYVISSKLRARLGLGIQVWESDGARLNAADDANARVLWLLAPTLGIEMDL